MNSRSAPATIQVFTTECARRSAHRGGGSTAFTLIELLTAIAILSVLLCILTPSLSRARNLARNVYCANNARSLAVAQMTWSVAHDQQITPLDDDNLGQTVLDIAEARKNCWGDLLIWGGYATKNAFACPNDTRPINEARPDKARMSYGMNYYAYAVLSPPPGWRSKALLSPGLDVANPGEKIMLLDGDYWHEVFSALWSARAGGTWRHEVDWSASYAFFDGHARTITFEEMFGVPFDPAVIGTHEMSTLLAQPVTPLTHRHLSVGDLHEPAEYFPAWAPWPRRLFRYEP